MTYKPPTTWPETVQTLGVAVLFVALIAFIVWRLTA